MIAFFLFLFGMAIGSFLNVVIYRLNNPLPKEKLGRSFGFAQDKLGKLGGRSFCPKCKHQLSWKDNIPLLSFALLKGKCRYCRRPIYWQYPLVELATAVLTIAVFYLSPINPLITIYYLLITYSLIAIFVIDLLYQVIPDEIIWPMALLSIGVALYLGLFTEFFFPAVAGSLFFLVLVILTREKGMGWGDVKFAGLMGLFLGWSKLAIALYLAFLTGALVGVILILLKKKRFGQAVPFGPFLTTGAWIALFFGDKIWYFVKGVLP